ncbi:hypothetical protein MIMGU_mgv1a008113mg [Erythranthe guttata]|uniref:DUF4005 domain-containing protein n=1 Tax=Erythranthe guttata TaxID=4155 RepID=A0A022RG68_ERYGU|nr:hypothetical protein MIMGU_mgv1a008113mg [Erythranthe guttata]
MGKASKWFRGLLGLSTTTTNAAPTPKPPPKRKWSFAKPHRETDPRNSQHRGHPNDNDDASKHAIAVAAATAAVADAAVAAAQAAASVVQLTSSSRGISTAAARTSRSAVHRQEWAAVTIQSHFRGYLSRRALRALKALVKLQALVRGHLVRKQTAYTLRRLQALVRAQVRARAGRCLSSDSPHSSIKSSHFNCNGPPTPEKFEHVIRARSMKHEQHLITMLKRNGSNRTDKILEMDTENIPHAATTKRRSLFYSAQLTPGPTQHCRSFSTPTYYSASSSRGGSSKRGAFTPTKSEASRSCLSGYSDHPNYMAYTESSKAKARSISAPKQRPVQIERSTSSTKRYSVHANFTTKGYPGSGRLDRLGMPIRGEVSGGGGGGYWQRY